MVRIFADNNNNALVNYAANNSNSVAALVGEATGETKKAILNAAKHSAVYKLDDTILTESRDRAGHAVTCSVALDVTVADTTAQKKVEFNLKQTKEGMMLISVDPFLF